MSNPTIRDTGGSVLRRLISALIFLFLAVVLFLGWAQGRDFSWALRAEAETRGQALLGRPVTIEGAIGFEWRINEIWVFADDVRTDEPQGEATLGAALTAERAGATLGLWKLLQGRVELRGVGIRNAEVILPVSEAAGIENQTVIAEAIDQRADRILGMLERLREVDIDNLHLIRERVGEDNQVFDIDHLVLVPEGEGLRAAFVGEAQGSVVDVSGHLHNLASFLRQDSSAISGTARVGQNTMDISGTLTSVWPVVGDLNFEGVAGDVSHLSAIAGFDVPGAGTATLVGSVRLTAGRGDIVIDALEIERNEPAEDANLIVLGPLSGAISVYRRDGIIRAEGEITMAHLDTGLLRSAVPSEDVVDTESNAAHGARRSLLDVAVPMERFDRAAGQVTLHIDELQHRGLTFADVDLPITAEAGTLSLDGASATYRGAPLELSLNANAHDETVRLSAQVRDFDLGALLEDIGRRPIIVAPTHLAVDGVGTGRTVRDVMATFTGQSNVSLGEGSLGQGGIDFLAADLLTAFFAGNEQGRTPLRCMVSRIDFEDGVGRSQALLLDTNLITITGRGRVFLGENRIDFHLSPRPKNPTLLNLAADYNVDGEILSPSISPDTGDLIRGVATSIGGLALTGGTAALLPLLNMGDDVENACLEALAGEAPVILPSDEAANDAGATEELAEPAGE